MAQAPQYREFCKIAALGAPETANNGVVMGLMMRIPYSMKQGIILSEQGILARKKGIVSSELKSSPDEIFGTKDFWRMSYRPCGGQTSVASPRGDLFD